MSPASRLLLACGAGAIILALASPRHLDGQLVVENPLRKWRAGEVVELIVRGQVTQTGRGRLEEVRFDDWPIAFELVNPGSEDEVARVRIRVPLTIKPGAHQVSVRFSEVARPEPVTVPDIRGVVVAEAQRLLQDQGLSVDAGRVPAALNDGVFLVVTAQQPQPGARVSPGARVVVELGRRSEVPGILGLAVDEARLRLREHALELAFAAEFAAPTAQTVTRQDPAAGVVVEAGSTVTVETAVTVPDLVGKWADEAKSILSSVALEFRPSFVAQGLGPYRAVVGQEPTKGQSVPPGSSIVVVFERLRDPPPPEPPWGWIVLTGALGAALVQQRARIRRGLRKSYRLRANNDLEGLRTSATAPAWSDREFKLDVRLLGIPDRGRQSLEIEGPLVMGTLES